MNDFDYDCMQKKRVARGAFAHINRKRGGRNEKMWQSKVAEWANADAVAVHTEDAQVEGGHIISDAPKAEKPQTGVKLLHARLEMSGDREALLANLRVLMPDEGQVTVEW